MKGTVNNLPKPHQTHTNAYTCVRLALPAVAGVDAAASGAAVAEMEQEGAVLMRGGELLGSSWQEDEEGRRGDEEQ